MGVDIVIAQGSEAGGHVGTVTTMVLVPQVVDAVRVPVLAAGGIADGRAVAASLVLGAQGAWIGTRFIATLEATAHENHKKGILAADEDGTIVSRSYTGKPSRVLKNRFTDRWKGHEGEILPMPWQRIWVEPLVAPAKAAGRVDLANFPTGQVAGGIADIPPAAEVFARLVAEARQALGQ
jgi:enoyl-[acyl-carrier protein] reductase II